MFRKSSDVDFLKTGKVVIDADGVEVDLSLPLRLDTTVGTRIFAGNTMIHGDTGWRNVSANLFSNTYIPLIPNSNSHGIFVKRVNDEVYWRINLRVSAALAGSARSTRRTFLNVPSGFGQNPVLFTKYANINLGSGTIGITNASSGGVMQTEDSSLSGVLVEGEILSGTFNYSTSSTWPTTLPGLPA